MSAFVGEIEENSNASKYSTLLSKQDYWVSRSFLTVRHLEAKLCQDATSQNVKISLEKHVEQGMRKAP